MCLYTANNFYRRLQRERIVLRQAIRLREDRAQALITAERVRLQRAIDLAKYR